MKPIRVFAAALAMLSGIVGLTACDTARAIPQSAPDSTPQTHEITPSDCPDGNCPEEQDGPNCPDGNCPEEQDDPNSPNGNCPEEQDDPNCPDGNCPEVPHGAKRPAKGDGFRAPRKKVPVRPMPRPKPTL